MVETGTRTQIWFDIQACALDTSPCSSRINHSPRYLQNPPPNRRWPCLGLFTLSWTLVNQKRRVLQRSGLQFHSTQQGKGGGGVFFTLVVKLQENFSPSGPAISSTAWISAKQQVEKTRDSSDHKQCKDQGPLISACNESCTTPAKIFRKKETGERSKKTQSPHTLGGFCYPNAHWHRGHLLQSELSTED